MFFYILEGIPGPENDSFTENDSSASQKCSGE